jgi:hypothetical protein
MNELILSIKDGEHTIKATNKKDDGTVTTKHITRGSLLSSITSGMTLKTDLLVRGTRFYFGEPEKYIVGIESVPKVRPLLFGYEEPYKKLYVPYPPCLFFFKVVNGVVNETYLFSLRNSIMSYNDSLYRFPFGNAYDDGRVCWGYAGSGEALKSPMQLGSHLAAFFDSPYNGDLQEGSFRKITPKDYPAINNIVDLVYYLNGKDKFDYELLNPTSYSVSDIIKLLGGIL